MILDSQTKAVPIENLAYGPSGDSYDDSPHWKSSSAFGAAFLVDNIFSCIAEFVFIVIYSFSSTMAGS